MPTPLDLLSSANRASKIHNIPDVVTTLDTVSDSDRFVIDRRDVNGNWLNKQISATDVKAQVATASVVPPIENTIQDGMVLELFDDYSLGAISSFTKGTGWLGNGVGTGCTIVSRTQADGRSHKRLQIIAGQYGRTLPWGKYWNRLKIVCLWRVNKGSTINPVDGYLGVCSGMVNMVASATTDNYIGVRWGDGASALTFTAGTAMNYFNMGVGYRFYTRRGTTSTLIAAGGSGHSVSASEGYLSPIIFDVSRAPFANDAASVLYSVKEASPGTPRVESSLTKDLIKGLLISSSTSVLSLSELETAAIGNAGNNSGNFNQSTGGLDTVNISWPHADGLELAGIGVVKVH